MSRKDEEGRRPARPARLAALAALAAAGLVAASAGASPATMGAMGKGGVAGHGHGYSHGYGHHRLRPHNAARHFLMMAGRLGLDAQQQDRLRELRDRWIQEHAATEAALQAARQDLQAVLRADTVDKAKAEELLTRIGRLEQELWRAFIDQLATIKDMLTPEQRARLRMMHRRMMGRGTMGGVKDMGAAHPMGGP